MNFNRPPLLVIWEDTQARDLVCNPAELASGEAFSRPDRIREFGSSLVVFSGGGPRKRPDPLLLLGRSVALGLHTHLSPSATRLTCDASHLPSGTEGWSL